MVQLKEFRKANGLQQQDLCEFWKVAKSFVSQVENGKSPLPAQKLSELLVNDKGWDTSMLMSNSPMVEAKLGNKAKLAIGDCNDQSDSGNVEALKEMVRMLQQQLAEEKERSERYLRMIENMMTK